MHKDARHVQGKCFAGRVAVSVKGIKFSADGKKVAPMLHVCQVLEHDFLINTNAADVALSTCIIDDTTVVPTAPAVPAAEMMNADTDELDSDNERVLIAYIEAENRRLDEEIDSAFVSTCSN